MPSPWLNRIARSLSDGMQVQTLRQPYCRNGTASRSTMVCGLAQNGDVLAMLIWHTPCAGL